MRARIDDTIYEVLAVSEDGEICVLQTFPYTDGLKKQLKVWTSSYILLRDDKGGYLNEYRGTAENNTGL